MDERRLGSSYRLVSRIGRGSMGEVWRAEGPHGPVAIKILRPEFADEPDVVHRFLQERTILRTLASEHIVAVRDLVAEGDQLGIVMELIVGQDLRHLLRSTGPLRPVLAIDIALQALDGLRTAHAANVIHRDLKPENILIDERPAGVVVKIVDFGIARIASGSGLTQATAVVGTPKYLAPELLSGDPLTPAVDIYALGVVLYEMLFGVVPFDAAHPAAVLRAHADDPPPRPPDVPDRLWAAIAVLLEKSPVQRPDATTAIATLTALRPSLARAPVFRPPDHELADDQPTITDLPTPPDTPVSIPRTARRSRRRARRRWPVAVGIGLLIAAVAGTATVVVASRDSSAACVSGAVRAPHSDVSVADGTVVHDGARYGLETAGALFPITEAQADDVPHTSTRDLSADDFDRLDRRPRPEAVLTETGSDHLYFSAGGAVFPTTQVALTRFRPNAATPVTVPLGSLIAAPRSPRSGSLIQVDGPGRPIWLIRHGSRDTISTERLCSLPQIIRVPNSAGVLAEIPLHRATVTTTTSRPSPSGKGTTTPTLPDPLEGLVARECQRQGDAVVAGGTLTNTGYRQLPFVVHVRLLAADGTELGRQDSATLDIPSNGAASWSVRLTPPPAGARIDRCEYRVERLGTGAPAGS